MSAAVEWFRSHAPEFAGQVLYDEPLSKCTYYRIGGPARVLAIPKTRDDLVWLARGLKETGLPYFILGFGSNVLVSDTGFGGVVIRTSKMNLDISAESNSVHTGASVAISSFLRRASVEGWGGLEFLTGIPGSIGGAVYMNGGTHLGESSGALTQVEYISLRGAKAGESVIVQGSDLKYKYRKNLFLPTDSIVWSATWKITKDDPSRVKAAIDETLARRKATQPLDYPSCGSVFKNPKESGQAAWQVVDKLGLRGHRIGDAQFAEKHSNWILNLGAARAADVRALIDLAKSRASSELGIALEEEVQYVGD